MKDKPIFHVLGALVVLCAVEIVPCIAAGSIGGQITDEASQAITGGHVSVVKDLEVYGSDTSSTYGSYTVVGLPAGMYDLHVTADGYALRIVQNVLVQDNTHTTRNISNFAAESRISGKVTASNETTGIAHILVTASHAGGWGPRLFAVTDSVGNYTVTNLPAGTYNVTASDAEHLFQEVQEVTVAVGASVDNVDFVETDTGTITGMVSDALGGIANKAVEVFQPANPSISKTRVTDSSGNYTFTLLPIGTYTVRVLTSAGRFPDSTGVTVSAGGTRNVNLVMATGTVRGKVTKSSGSSPIAEVVVLARRALPSPSSGYGVTDGNGDYAIEDLPPGTYVVEVYDLTGATLVSANNVSVSTGSVTTVNLDTSAGAIAGTVRDSSQNPIMDILVLVSGNNTIRASKTDGNGGYSATGLPAGDYEIKVFPANGYIGQTLSDIGVQANAETQQDITLLIGGTISGNVSNGAGGIAGASVSALCTDPTCSTGITDASGDFTVSGLPTGTFTIVVQAVGYVSESEVGISVTIWQDSPGHDFVLGTSGGSISGTVYETDGTTPISGALVSCYCPGKSAASATTDASGCYMLPLLQGGIYEISALAAGFQPQSLANVVVTGTQQNDGNDLTLSAE